MLTNEEKDLSFMKEEHLWKHLPINVFINKKWKYGSQRPTNMITILWSYPMLMYLEYKVAFVKKKKEYKVT
jgi:hypothetical protein